MTPTKPADLSKDHLIFFGEEIIKVAAAKWVGHFKKLLDSKKFTKAEDMATGLTSGRIYEGKVPGYQGHVANLRASIGSGLFKKRTGVKLTNEGIVNMTRRSVKETRTPFTIPLKERLYLYKKDKGSAEAFKSLGAGRPYSKELKEIGAVAKKPLNVIHGSTDRNINSFLKGKNKGVDIYSKNKGLWVHPSQTKKDMLGRKGHFTHKLYKNFHTLEFGGRPATLTGKVKSNKLTSVGGRPDEAGLPNTSLKSMTDIKVDVSPVPRKEIFAAVPRGTPSLSESTTKFTKPSKNKSGGMTLKKAKKILKKDN